MSAIEKIGTPATEPDPRLDDQIDPGADINESTIPGPDTNIMDQLGDIHRKASEIIAKHRAWLNKRLITKQAKPGP